jgi:hypothetical protein
MGGGQMRDESTHGEREVGRIQQEEWCGHCLWKHPKPGTFRRRVAGEVNLLIFLWSLGSFGKRGLTLHCRVGERK